jgi:hypothetical protein
MDKTARKILALHIFTSYGKTPFITLAKAPIEDIEGEGEDFSYLISKNEFEFRKNNSKLKLESGWRDAQKLRDLLAKSPFALNLVSFEELPSLFDKARINYKGSAKPLVAPMRKMYLRDFLQEEPPMVPEGTDLQIWTWEEKVADKTQHYLIVFRGRSDKPLAHHWFANDQKRMDFMEKIVKANRDALASKKQDQQKRKEFQTSIQVGDIYYTSWGYDQTNVSFYQVVAVKGKMIEARLIGKKIVGSEAGSDYVVPVKGDFRGTSFKALPREISNGREAFKVKDESAWEWEGKPVYQTASGWGH